MVITSLVEVLSPNTASVRQRLESSRQGLRHWFSLLIPASTLSISIRLLPSQHRAFGGSSVRYATRRLGPPHSSARKLPASQLVGILDVKTAAGCRAGREESPVQRSGLAELHITDVMARHSSTHLNAAPYTYTILMSGGLSTGLMLRSPGYAM